MLTYRRYLVSSIRGSPQRWTNLPQIDNGYRLASEAGKASVLESRQFGNHTFFPEGEGDQHTYRCLVEDSKVR